VLDDVLDEVAEDPLVGPVIDVGLPGKVVADEANVVLLPVELEERRAAVAPHPAVFRQPLAKGVESKAHGIA
jgi:hypothetical protein